MIVIRQLIGPRYLDNRGLKSCILDFGPILEGRTRSEFWHSNRELRKLITFDPASFQYSTIPFSPSPSIRLIIISDHRTRLSSICESHELNPCTRRIGRCSRHTFTSWSYEDFDRAIDHLVQRNHRQGQRQKRQDNQDSQSHDSLSAKRQQTHVDQNEKIDQEFDVKGRFCHVPFISL